MSARHGPRAAIAIALVLAMSGCAPAAPERVFTAAAAEELQAGVLAVSESASAGAWAEAAGALDELEAAAIAAYSRGDLSDTRFDAMMVAIGLVRNDLQAALAEAKGETAEPTAPVNPEAPSSDSGGTGGGATGEPAPAPEQTAPSTGNGKGNGNGNPGEPGPPPGHGKPKD